MPFTHIPGVSIRYTPAGFASVIYDGTDIPEDSVLHYDSGLENTPYTEGTVTTGGATSFTDSAKSLLWTNNQWSGYRAKNSTAAGETGSIVGNSTTVITATLTGAEVWDIGDVYIIQHTTLLKDTTKTWTPSEWVDFRLVNSTDGSAGIITANTPTTLTVSSLTGGTQNVFSIGDDYKIVSPIDINDKIEFESTTNLNGTVAMSTKGVPSITGASGTHTFNFRLVDVSLGQTSAEVLFTVTI